MNRITVLDILDHPTYSFNADYATAFTDPSGIDLDILPGTQNGVIADLDPSDVDGLIISGSISGIFSGAPWIPDMVDLLERFRSDGSVPVLAICMTHELLVHLEGGKVFKNPLGSEIGTVDFNLTPEGRKDPLFDGFPPQFAMQSAHSHDVVEVPDSITVLAANGRSPCQALRRDNIWGVQFHPDLTAASLLRWLKVHADPEDLIRQGIVANEEELRAFLDHRIFEVPWRHRLFDNFAALCGRQEADLS